MSPDQIVQTSEPKPATDAIVALQSSGPGMPESRLGTASEGAAAPVRSPEPRFISVLFLTPESREASADTPQPDYFGDLNLDQFVGAVTAGKEEYSLATFFHYALRDTQAIAFRHEVMRDLERMQVSRAIGDFATGMHKVREQLGQLSKRYYDRQKDRWFLDAVLLYSSVIQALHRDLAATRPESRALKAVCDYVGEYLGATEFRSRLDRAKRLENSLADIRYNIFIQGGRVTVRNFDGAADYNAEIKSVFERFQQASGNERRFDFSNSPDMDHVEARILDGVASLNQQTFDDLRDFRANGATFRDGTITDFDREIQFYVAYLNHIDRLKKLGLDFCYPVVSTTEKAVRGEGAFDIALATKMLGQSSSPVTNDFFLRGAERIIVVSGPNQGGKTTFARMFGQLHYLASLGCPVPGQAAAIFIPDRIFTHFERQEHAASLQGKLEEEISRIGLIQRAATPQSIVIINEIFASTALRDAIALSRKIVTAFSRLDLLCVWVTFIEEISTLNEKTVSMVSTVVAGNPAQRTFKVVRRVADGLAYAMSLAEKYKLTRQAISQRIRT